MEERDYIAAGREALADSGVQARAELIRDRIQASAGLAIDALCEELALVQLRNEQLARLVRNYQQMLSLKDQALPLFQDDHRALLKGGVVLVDARFPLRAEDGFYGVEYTAEDEAYRWTGPDACFSFDLLLNRGVELQGELRLLDAASSDCYEGLSCFVDGQRAQLARQETAVGAEYVFPIPAGEGLGANIVFFTPQTRIPKNAAPGDRRLLGVAFQRLEIRPVGSEL